jgi:hypothetical protein
MAFWEQMVEPLRKNRWKANITGFTEFGTTNTYTYALKKADKPSFKVSDITHKFGNYNFYYPGRVEWNTINLTFAAVDKLDHRLLSILKGGTGANAGYHIPADEASALKGVSKAGFVNNVGAIEIIQINAQGEELEKWRLEKPFFTNIKFGELSYESEEIIDIEVTVRFDSATYTQKKAQ